MYLFMLETLSGLKSFQPQREAALVDKKCSM